MKRMIARKNVLRGGLAEYLATAATHCAVLQRHSVPRATVGILLAGILSFAGLLVGADLAQGADFKPLFDGKTLSGWEGNEKLFRVEEGAIVAGSLQNRIVRNEFLCTTREYTNFELRAKVMLKGEGHNAGIQFRSARIPNEAEVKGYQCDVGSEGEKLIWGFLYDESRRRKYLAECPQERIHNVVNPDDWNELTIYCEGDRIRILVNGVETVDYREMDSDIPRRGIIGLQIHSGKPSEAWYKDIEIRELPDR